MGYGSNIKSVLAKWEGGDLGAKDALIKRVAFRILSVAKLTTSNGESPWLVEGKVYAFTTDSYLKSWQTKSSIQCRSVHMTGKELSKLFKDTEVVIKIDEGEPHSATLADEIVKQIAAAKENVAEEIQAARPVVRQPQPTFQPQPVQQQTAYMGAGTDPFGGMYIEEPVTPQFIPPAQAEEYYEAEQVDLLHQDEFIQEGQQILEEQQQFVEEGFIEQEQEPFVEQQQVLETLVQEAEFIEELPIEIPSEVPNVMPAVASTDLTAAPIEEELIPAEVQNEPDTSILVRDKILGFPVEEEMSNQNFVNRDLLNPDSRQPAPEQQPEPIQMQPKIDPVNELLPALPDSPEKKLLRSWSEITDDRPTAIRQRPAVMTDFGRSKPAREPMIASPSAISNSGLMRFLAKILG